MPRAHPGSSVCQPLYPSGAGRVYWQRRNGRRDFVFQGQSYPFKLGGLGIGGIGILTIDADGWVYNLRRPADFNGVYGQLRSGWSIGQHGSGEMWLKNANGVILRLRARRQGLSLSLGADGMVVRLGA
jgi:hypothetical protein